METVQQHYRALWKQGIAVDVIDEERDLSGYRLVIAPMLYLLRGGIEERLQRFVEGGGTLVGTYLTGLVNENDLCYLGGWPGAGLRELFGVWNESTDGLWDGEKNTLCMGEKTYEIAELCALIHAEGARVLGTYGEDFYRGEPALTVNGFGAGKAYYIAARTENRFCDDFYHELAEELGLKKALDSDPPQGVEACLRETEEERYLFLQNFSGVEKSVSLPHGYRDFQTGEEKKEVVLPPYGSAVLQGSTK